MLHVLPIRICTLLITLSNYKTTQTFTDLNLFIPMSCCILHKVHCYVMCGIVVCMLCHSVDVGHTHKLQFLALNELVKGQDSDVMSVEQ